MKWIREMPFKSIILGHFSLIIIFQGSTNLIFYFAMLYNNMHKLGQPHICSSSIYEFIIWSHVSSSIYEFIIWSHVSSSICFIGNGYNVSIHFCKYHLQIK